MALYQLNPEKKPQPSWKATLGHQEWKSYNQAYIFIWEQAGRIQGSKSGECSASDPSLPAVLNKKILQAIFQLTNKHWPVFFTKAACVTAVSAGCISSL